MRKRQIAQPPNKVGVPKAWRAQRADDSRDSPWIIRLWLQRRPLERFVLSFSVAALVLLAASAVLGRGAVTSPPQSQPIDSDSYSSYSSSSQRDVVMSQEMMRQIPPHQLFESHFGHTNKLTDFEGCNINFRPKPPRHKNWQMAPFWFPSYPDSFDDDMVRRLITGITGHKGMAKSYYEITDDGGGKCQGSESETSLCMLIHPIKKTNPENFEDNFQDELIYGIRNPITAFPAHFNARAVSLKDQVGQVPEDEWRKFRDEHLHSLMDQWKDQIRTWLKLEEMFEVCMFIRYEHLMDVWYGPLALMRIARRLGDANFDVAREQDLPCIWYKSIGRDALEQYAKHGYEYGDYKPGYTEDQRDYLMREITDFKKEHRDNLALVQVLNDYYAYIRDYVVLDRPWSNQTAGLSA